ncbi:hypothetical protein L596_002034 [Steinernema carpocapsae]|uniref:Kinesin motor domain-containing protein n=1 Tax=Steinernema carpocapsae TaxID=34508 RepID=A0A4U8UNH5_STECR|nr:hypothetical protein L596_002034 [Steinernema carpocapsae]
MMRGRRYEKRKCGPDAADPLFAANQSGSGLAISLVMLGSDETERRVNCVRGLFQLVFHLKFVLSPSKRLKQTALFDTTNEATTRSHVTILCLCDTEVRTPEFFLSGNQFSQLVIASTVFVRSALNGFTMGTKLKLLF